MTESNESAKHLIKEFEQVLEQEDVTAEKLKNYLYNREKSDTTIKNLLLGMHEIQAKKRQIHRKLRGISNTIH